MDSENYTENITENSSNLEGLSAEEKSLAQRAEMEREAVESEFLNKLLLQRTLEYDLRNLKLLNRIKAEFGTLEAFKESRTSSAKELQDLTDFMTSLGEGDSI